MTFASRRGLRELVLILSSLAWGGCAIEAGRVWRAADRAALAEPLHTPIDLSRAGRTTVPLHQTFADSCNQLYLLRGSETFESSTKPVVLLRGLDGVVRVKSAAEVLVSESVWDAAHARLLGGDILVSGFNPFAVGEYTAEIDITSIPLTHSTGPLRLISRYQICGLEHLAALGYGACACFWGVLGMVAWAYHPSPAGTDAAARGGDEAAESSGA